MPKSRAMSKGKRGFLVRWSQAPGEVVRVAALTFAEARQIVMDSLWAEFPGAVKTKHDLISQVQVERSVELDELASKAERTVIL